MLTPGSTTEKRPTIAGLILNQELDFKLIFADAGAAEGVRSAGACGVDSNRWTK
jgi:hypothetical protein